MSNKGGRSRKWRYFACDFETTVYEGQQFTEVWSSACVELYTEAVKVFHSIGDTLNYFKSLRTNVVLYYHNLKFDGSFWLYYLKDVLHLEEGLTVVDDITTMNKKYEMENNTYVYSISDRGMWYTIDIKLNNQIIEIRDSLKLLPFSLKQIGRDFKTKHQKLEMEYTGFRYSGCNISDEEMEYIKNDVLVLKEALEIMFNEGHTKLTIGSCCLEEYKRIIGSANYDVLFPNVYDEKLNPDIFGEENAGDYIRHSYKGGWCYVRPQKCNRIYKHGLTADVNSLYPSVMHSESGNYYPIGQPTFWYGNFIPQEAMINHRYYFLRIRTRFKIRNGYLPFIQIKGNNLYKGTECLETSDIKDKKTGKYYPCYRDANGKLHQAYVTLTLTSTDYKLFLEHYDAYECEILDGCWFEAEKGIFDDYINKYKQIKMTSKGARRTLAKLFLNNLYGKMASNTDSSFKVAYIGDDKALHYYIVNEKNKKPGYIPVGSAITSYAREFTIRTAQKNFYGDDKDGFIYADTDSIHCSLTPERLKGVRVHPTDFCAWKLESVWDMGIFVRQKTYIERVIEEDSKPCEPYYNIKCAGLPDNCKELFLRSVRGETAKDSEPEDVKEFLSKQRKISDFKTGLKIPQKLRPVNIRGGTLLVPSIYTLH